MQEYLSAYVCVCMCMYVPPQATGQSWGISIERITIRHLSTNTVTDFAGAGQWLGERPHTQGPITHTPHTQPAPGPFTQAPLGTAAQGGGRAAAAAGGTHALRLLPAGTASFTFNAR